MRGDEPYRQGEAQKLVYEFPTCVGMNRFGVPFFDPPDLSSPHAWG